LATGSGVRFQTPPMMRTCRGARGARLVVIGVRSCFVTLERDMGRRPHVFPSAARLDASPYRLMISPGHADTVNGGWLSKPRRGLTKTRVNIVGLFSGGLVDEAFLKSSKLH
jgi:hypothetical protein